MIPKETERWEDPEINVATSVENSEPLNGPITQNP
jgi:hypothetical protein